MPALMRQWLFTSANSEIVDVSVDLRVGGSFSILERPFGEYLEVIPSRRLAFTFQTPAHFPQQTRIEVAIAPVGSGSSLDFRQTPPHRSPAPAFAAASVAGPLREAPSPRGPKIGCYRRPALSARRRTQRNEASAQARW